MCGRCGAKGGVGWGEWVEDETDDSSLPTNAIKMRRERGRGPRVAPTRLKAPARAPPIPGRHFNFTVALFKCFLLF